MPVIVPCPYCGQGLRIPEAAFGKTIRCPKCKEMYKAVPSATEVPQPELSPPLQEFPLATPQNAPQTSLPLRTLESNDVPLLTPIGTTPLNTYSTNPYASGSTQTAPIGFSPQTSSIPNPYALSPDAPSPVSLGIQPKDWHSHIEAVLSSMGMRIPRSPLTLSQMFGVGLITIVGLGGAFNILWTLAYVIVGHFQNVIFLAIYPFLTYTAFSGFYGVLVDDTHFNNSRRYQRRKWLLGETLLKFVIFCVSGFISFLLLINYFFWFGLLVIYFTFPDTPNRSLPDPQRQTTPGEGRFPNSSWPSAPGPPGPPSAPLR